jgi:hypothetical protein
MKMYWGGGGGVNKNHQPNYIQCSRWRHEVSITSWPPSHWTKDQIKAPADLPLPEIESGMPDRSAHNSLTIQTEPHWLADFKQDSGETNFTQL